MKNNIMIMNFSGVYEMQGLKTALEKKVDSVVAEAENMAAKPVITQLDFRTFLEPTVIAIVWQRKRSERGSSFWAGGTAFFRLRQLPLSDKVVAGVGKRTL